ncbi:NAD(P)-binding protein [Apiospora sp. TS-2023a]
MPGANNGIGYETVAALSSASSDFHVLLGSRSPEKGQTALEGIRSSLGDSLKASISVVQLDVTDAKSIEAAKGRIEREFGRLDVLISNAGIIVYEPVDTLTALRRCFETNVFGAMMVTEALEPLLRKSSRPYLIYVSSDMGSITNRLDPDFKHKAIRGETYRMSKSALNMLAACHRYNYADWCKVLAFNPGWCISDLTGPQGREMRIQGGARDPKEAALALLEVVRGNRDADIARNGMVDIEGGISPW